MLTPWKESYDQPTSAAVAIAEGQIEITASVPLQTLGPAPVDRGGIGTRFVKHVQEGRNQGTIHAAPQEGVVGERLRVIIGP